MNAVCAADVLGKLLCDIAMGVYSARANTSRPNAMSDNLPQLMESNTTAATVTYQNNTESRR